MKKARTVASKKAKGRSLCKDIKKLIHKYFKFEEDDVQVTSSGAAGEDIVLSPQLRKKLPISAECKNMEALSLLWKAYEQATKNSPTKAEPVVFLKRNFDKPLAVMNAEYFIRTMYLLDYYKGNRTEGQVIVDLMTNKATTKVKYEDVVKETRGRKDE